MQQISPYYLLFLKGSIKHKTNRVPDLNEAADLLEKALTIKETEEAFKELASVYMKLGNTEMYEKTILRGANKGFVFFYTSCGLFYANKADKDETSVLEWFNKGIEAKDSRCYMELAKLYILGCPAFKPNFDYAEKLLLEGLNLHNHNWEGLFANTLGLFYYEKKMYLKAEKYYKLAIELGHMDSTFNIALMYRDGVGVEKNPEKYMSYIMMHLNKNNAYEIGSVYLSNVYCPKDEEIALLYFQYAANHGDPRAAIMCACIFADRNPSNESVVNTYLELAFRNGRNDETLKNSLDMIEKEFGESRRQKFKELAEKYWNMRRSEA